MAPTDKLRLPFRWEFTPVKPSGGDGSICWRWRAHSQSGELVLESTYTFETLTDCMADARTHGYARYD